LGPHRARERERTILDPCAKFELESTVGVDSYDFLFDLASQPRLFDTDLRARLGARWLPIGILNSPLDRH
jgi:hypothetical protein